MARADHCQRMVYPGMHRVTSVAAWPGHCPGPSSPGVHTPRAPGWTPRSSRSTWATARWPATPCPECDQGERRTRSPWRTWPVMNAWSSGWSKTSRRSASTSASIARRISTPEASRAGAIVPEGLKSLAARSACGSSCPATRKLAISQAIGITVTSIENDASSYVTWMHRMPPGTSQIAQQQDSKGVDTSGRNLRQVQSSPLTPGNDCSGRLSAPFPCDSGSISGTSALRSAGLRGMIGLSIRRSSREVVVE